MTDKKKFYRHVIRPAGAGSADLLRPVQNADTAF